jgi:GNAT superfamily N-acetyltransferase
VNYTIRPIAPSDCFATTELIRELAEFEKLGHLVESQPELLQNALFGKEAFLFGLVATIDEKVVAYALYFRSYSTFIGKPGFYLEDLYVQPQYRGIGIGKSMLQTIARQAVELGYRRFEWTVLDWNKPAIDFYESIGARGLKEWILYRMDGEHLQNFSNKQ